MTSRLMHIPHPHCPISPSIRPQDLSPLSVAVTRGDNRLKELLKSSPTYRRPDESNAATWSRETLQEQLSALKNENERLRLQLRQERSERTQQIRKVRGATRAARVCRCTCLHVYRHAVVLGISALDRCGATNAQRRRRCVHGCKTS